MDKKLKGIPKEAMRQYRVLAKKFGVPKELFVEFCVLSEEYYQKEMERRNPNIPSMGGIARKKSLSAKRRKEIATKAAKARWAKKK